MTIKKAVDRYSRMFPVVKTASWVPGPLENFIALFLFYIIKNSNIVRIIMRCR